MGIKWLSIACFWLSSFGVYAQTEYFISTEGKDMNLGSIEAPFASLEKALEEARKESGEVTLFLREGTYRLQKTVVLTKTDGNRNKALNIRSYPGEKVVISGGQKLDLDWKPYKKGIMCAKIEGQVQMDMLLVNGEIRHMARYPNYDEQAIRFNGTSAEATAPSRVKQWKHPGTGYLHAMHRSDWGDFHYRITGKDDKNQLVLEGGWQNNRQSGLHPDNRMVENIFEELDAPGEWFFDTEESVLYYYPIEGENMEKAVVETPQLKHLFEIRGTEADPVMNIRLDGLQLTQTMRTFMERYEPLLRSDWTIYRGAAVFMEGTERCSLSDCDLYNLGGNAVFFSKYNRNAEVSGSHFTNIGASAICFVGDPQCVRSPSFEYSLFVPFDLLDREKGPKGNNYPSNCVVKDNLIHKIGLFEKQITGIELSMSQSIIISHNSIYDTPRAGINVSEGTWGGHIIEYNDIFDTVKETGDHGSFNSWGRDRFWHPDYKTMEEMTTNHPELVLLDAVKTTTIRHNRFRCDRGWDIDLDDGSSNYHIYNNLCLNGGIKLREGFYRIVENNIIINNSFHPHVWFLQSGDVFSRNIVMSAYKPIQVRKWGLMVDYNIFTDSIALQAAHKNGTDKNSWVSDVLFANPSVGDFILSDNSEAIVNGGFHNFPMDEFGVQSLRLKSISRQPEMPVPIISYGGVRAQIERWQGVELKNLTTLGERSATGMDSERGVYVLSVDPLESMHTLLKTNDVILKVNNRQTNTSKEFFEALKDSKPGDKITLVVFRFQKEISLSVELR